MLTINRSHEGEEDERTFEHLTEGKQKQVLFKDSQGGLIFPEFAAVQPRRDQAGEKSRGQVLQDSVYYAAECGFYILTMGAIGRF